MRIILSLTILLLSTQLSAQLQYLNSVEETQALSEEVTANFKDFEFSKAFNGLRKYWPLPDNEIDNIEQQSLKYLNLIKDRFGKTLRYKKIKNETISDIAVRETYLIQFEYTAVRVIFTYYKNDNGWLVNAFKWDDQFTQEFKE